MKQPSMFPTGEDLPLFSGTAQKQAGAVFAPADELYTQQAIAACRLCLDTGSIAIDGGVKPCWCPAGRPTSEPRPEPEQVTT